MALGVFDIIGPVMVGPSSSHTAGALKIGLALNSVLDSRPVEIDVTLFNSFADTGGGHGTKAAIVAGVLGFSTESLEVPRALEIAFGRGIRVGFRCSHDASRHPNSALIVVRTKTGVFAGYGESLGGGVTSFVRLGLEAVK